MTRIGLALTAAALVAAVASAQAQQPAQTPGAPAAPPAAAPAPAPPPFATTKVDGTDNVYIFRFAGHQSMFVVTPEGVIATDPIGLNRPHAVTTYIDEIKKITSAPIKYVVYSHHHYDHIAGGKPFKDLGATFVAHKNAKTRLENQKYPDIIIPDQAVDDSGTKITLGGTVLELHYVGRNHSDNSLVMRLPKEKIIFAVDFIPIASLHWRNMPDNVSPIEWEDSLKKVVDMDWDRLIPRPSLRRRSAWDQTGCAEPDRLHARPRGRGEEGAQ